MKKKYKIIIGAIILLPLVLLTGLQIYQAAKVRTTKPVCIDITAKDVSGHPVPNLALTTREYGWRYLVPIPWTWAWVNKGKIRIQHTDYAGNCTLSFQDDYMDLESVALNDSAFTNCYAVYHRHDGQLWTNTIPISWSYGFYPQAKEPYRRKYELIIRDTE
jgi:hypothetical protein